MAERAAEACDAAAVVVEDALPPDQFPPELTMEGEKELEELFAAHGPDEGAAIDWDEVPDWDQED